MLIYPEVKHQQKLHETYTWKKHKVSIHSIDLNQPWQKIHRDLFGLVGLM